MAHRTFQSRWNFSDRNELFFGLIRGTPEALLRCFQFFNPLKKNPTGTLGGGCRFTNALQKQIIYIYFSQASSARDFRNVSFSLRTAAGQKGHILQQTFFPHLVGSSSLTKQIELFAKSKRTESMSNFLLSRSWAKKSLCHRKKKNQDCLKPLVKKTSLFKATPPPPKKKKNWGGFRFFWGVVLGCFLFSCFISRQTSLGGTFFALFPFSVVTVTTLTSTGTALNESGHRPPEKSQKYETPALFFFLGGVGFFHSRGFYNGDPEILGRAPQKKKALRVSTRMLTCLPQKPVFFFLLVVAAVGGAFD